MLTIIWVLEVCVSWRADCGGLELSTLELVHTVFMGCCASKEVTELVDESGVVIVDTSKSHGAAKANDKKHDKQLDSLFMEIGSKDVNEKWVAKEGSAVRDQKAILRAVRDALDDLVDAFVKLATRKSTLDLSCLDNWARGEKWFGHAEVAKRLQAEVAQLAGLADLQKSTRGRMASGMIDALKTARDCVLAILEDLYAFELKVLAASKVPLAAHKYKNTIYNQWQSANTKLANGATEQYEAVQYLASEVTY